MRRPELGGPVHGSGRLGAGLAAELGLTRGDSLRLVLSADSSDRAQGTTAARSFGLVYAGAFSAGLFEVDQSGALALLTDAPGRQARARESYGSGTSNDTDQAPGEVSEIRLMLSDLSQRRQVLPRIRSRLPETLLISDRASDLFRDYDWVRAQGNAANLIVIVILIVAAFGVASGQLMMVQCEDGLNGSPVISSRLFQSISQQKSSIHGTKRKFHFQRYLFI